MGKDSMDHSSVTTWIGQLRQGDGAAAQKLWERYLEQLIALASQRLRNAPKRVSDEEDLVVNVFEEFRLNASRGKYPQLADRQDVWQILVQLVDHRAIDQIRRQAAYRKHVITESALDPEKIVQQHAPLVGVPSREPSPDEAAAFADELRALLGTLNDEESKQIVLSRLAGLSDSEIAQSLRCSLRTVERRMQQIRSCWADRLPAD
jgi:RNA polymerase sigma factor (sigma-70 family)